MQPPITLDTIRPLVAEARQQHDTMHFVFVCPVSGERVEASASMHAHRTVTDRVKESASHHMTWSLYGAVSRAIHRALGYNILGHIASDLAHQAIHARKEQTPVSYSQEAKDKALLEAFRYVSGSFRWDEEQRRYVSASVAEQRYISPFEQQLQNGRILLPYDQHMTSRILVDIASADSQLTQEEEHFLRQMLPPTVPSVEQLRAQGPVSQAEVEQISEGPQRDTVLMLAWTVAAIDRRIDGREAGRVKSIGDWLLIDPERATELRGWAFQYVLDQMLPSVYWGGQRNPVAYQEFIQTAQRLKIPQLDAERADAAWRKRHNIF
jgi:hypothetical protein